MKALIEKATNLIVKVDTDGGELAPEKPWVWVQCPNGMTSPHGWRFDGAQFWQQPSQFHEWDGQVWVLNEAKKAAHDQAVAEEQIAVAEELQAKALKKELKKGAVYASLKGLDAAGLSSYIETVFPGMTQEQREFMKFLATNSMAYAKDR